MPPKGSKVLNKKHAYLGKFQHNKGELSQMEKKIIEQELEILEKEALLNKKKE